MSNILIIGGTGYAGNHIAKEATRRGHEVVVLSRSAPQTSLEDVQYVQGSALDLTVRTRLLDGADIVVLTVSPRGDMAGKVRQLYHDIATEAAERNVRLVIVGGFSSLRPAPGKPRFFESGNVPEEYLAEAVEIAGVFDDLKRDFTDNLRWVFISPAAVFGAYAEVDDYGTPRVGSDVAIFDESGESKISGADFAVGVVNEIENSGHDKENISFVHQK
ncbi:NAD(P)H-binding protein [soil metagenome]